MNNREFWNNKILDWENEIYKEKKLGNSLANRMNIARQWLQENSSQETIIIELGCGTGKLIDKLELNFNKYYGIDLSIDAINMALDKKNEKCNFFCSDLSILNSLDIKNKKLIVISLGFIDWINHDERILVKKFQENNKNIKFLHSFSELRLKNLPIICLHKIYVFFKYGYKTNIMPKYDSKERIKKYFGNIKFLNRKNMSFGNFFTNE